MTASELVEAATRRGAVFTVEGTSVRVKGRLTTAELDYLRGHVREVRAVLALNEAIAVNSPPDGAEACARVAFAAVEAENRKRYEEWLSLVTEDEARRLVERGRWDAAKVRRWREARGRRADLEVRTALAIAALASMRRPARVIETLDGPVVWVGR